MKKYEKLYYSVVYEIIQELRESNSSLHKRKVLRKYKNNKDFQKFLTYALDPRITYGVKKYKKEHSNTRLYDLDDAYDLLDVLKQRKLTGNLAIQEVEKYYKHMTKEDALLFELILGKDLKSGVGHKIINEEMKPFVVFHSPYLGAQPFNEKKVKALLSKGKCISQIKYDGRFVNILYDGKLETTSRDGLYAPLLGALENEAKRFFESYEKRAFVLTGELLIPGYDRYTANGMISSYITIAKKINDGIDTAKDTKKFKKEYGFDVFSLKEKIKAIVWDLIPLENFYKQYYAVDYEERFDTLIRYNQKADNPFEIAEYKYVSTYSEALQHFKEMLARGEEGTILKGVKGHWKDKKPDYQFKMKLEFTVDLKIIGYNKGTSGTRLENTIGSLNASSKEGKLITNPGGIKDKERSLLWNNKEDFLDKIIEVKCCGVSQDRNGNYSLLHPCLVSVRDDKQEADSLDQILENERMILQLSE